MNEQIAGIVFSNIYDLPANFALEANAVIQCAVYCCVSIPCVSTQRWAATLKG